MNDDSAETATADRDAVASITRGETSGLVALYDRHARAVYALAVRIVIDPSDAEEVVQDVFTQAWRQSARYDVSRSSVAGWLLMMTRARAIDRLRVRQSRPDIQVGSAALTELPVDGASQELQVIGQQLARTINGAVRGLPDNLRRPIELAYFEGLSHTAIAERLGEPLGTVKTRVRSALIRLRSVFRVDSDR